MRHGIRNPKKLSQAFFFAALALAQTPPPPDTLVSPEVHSDRRVTFRIRAPKASEVTFFGDWMPVGTQEKMTRNTDGIWSVTLGPIPPSIYIYTFTVDGITMADPVNPRIKLRARTSASLVEVPSEPPSLPEARDVPHGAVEINWQKSKVLEGETRWVWIYTPPGYEKEPRRRYPVLYLFHGSNDTAGGWTLVGGANFILDNLLADKKAVPMIVVMPFGHAVPFGSPREMQAKNTTVFEDYVLKDVMPMVEAKYRVAAGRDMRAVAGLSMGGGQSIHIGFSHLDLFSAVGAFSAAVPADFETRFAQVLNDSKGTNAKLKAVWIGCGKQDSLFPRSRKFSELLAAHQIQHTFRATEGAHTYTVWRQYLGEFVPLLFR
jgi:enterochelin esterase family protein